MSSEIDMEIVPYTCIGPICFGDARETVRRKLGLPNELFQKDIGEVFTDAFDALGLHIYYDENGCVEFVEAFDPASPTLFGAPLVGRDILAVERELRTKGFDLQLTDVGLRCDAAGVAFTASDGVIEGVGVYSRGYYG